MRPSTLWLGKLLRHGGASEKDWDQALSELCSKESSSQLAGGCGGGGSAPLGWRSLASPAAAWQGSLASQLLAALSQARGAVRGLKHALSRALLQAELAPWW